MQPQAKQVWVHQGEQKYSVSVLDTGTSTVRFRWHLGHDSQRMSLSEFLTEFKPAPKETP